MIAGTCIFYYLFQVFRHFVPLLAFPFAIISDYVAERTGWEGNTPGSSSTKQALQVQHVQARYGLFVTDR